MRLIFIRHADPDYANDTLTPLGHAQARDLAEAFSKVNVDGLYCSPMGRAQHTAKYIGDRINHVPRVCQWLAELDTRCSQGKWAWDLPGTEVFANHEHPDLKGWHKWINDGDVIRLRVDKCCAQFDAFLKEHGLQREGGRYLLKSPAQSTLVLVCHAGVTLTLLAHLLHLSPLVTYTQFRCNPASLSTLNLQDDACHGVFRLIGLNETRPRCD